MKRQAPAWAGIAVLVVGGASLIVFALVATGHGILHRHHSADRSGEIAAAMAAQDSSTVTCSKTAFEVTNRLDQSKATIYSCEAGAGSRKCMTYENGIVRNVTPDVKLLVAGTYGDKPDCVD